MLRTRALSAVVLIPLVAGATYAGGWILAALVLVAVVLAAREFLSLMADAGYRPSLAVCVLVIVALLVIARLPDLDLLGLVLALSVIGTLIWQLLRPAEGLPTQSWALSLGAALWLGYLASFFVQIRDLSPEFGLGLGTRWLVMVFLVTWINDSAAYFVGKAIGKHHCCP